jgi:hypothetical protein
MMAEDEDDGDRVLFFEIGGLTRVVRDCHDVDDIEQAVGFTHCPICGGKRVPMAGKPEASYLEHELEYGEFLH